MSARWQRWTHAILGLGLCLALSSASAAIAMAEVAPAEAVAGAAEDTDPNVAAVIPASFDEVDTAPAPAAEMNAPAASDRSLSVMPRGKRNYTYRRYGKGSPAHRFAQSRFGGGGSPSLYQSFGSARAPLTGAAPPVEHASPKPKFASYAPDDGVLPEPTPADDQGPSDVGSVHSGPPLHGDSYPGQDSSGDEPDHSWDDGGSWGSGQDWGHDRWGNWAPSWARNGCCTLMSPWLWDNFSVFGGAQGFKGPPDQGRNGNFGFHEGVNWAAPIYDPGNIGFQFGGEAVHSDFYGANGGGGSLNQGFVTAALFRRPECGEGMQAGIAVDYRHDNFPADANLTRIRTEISLLGRRWHEIGVWTGVHTNSDTSFSSFTGGQVRSQAQDIYAGFYRRQFRYGGWARFYAGGTGDREGIIGGDGSAFLNQNWALQGAFNFLIPGESSTQANNMRESFAVTVNIVWYPAFKNRCAASNPYRPLFNVADNTNFFIRQR